MLGRPSVAAGSSVMPGEPVAHPASAVVSAARRKWRRQGAGVGIGRPADGVGLELPRRDITVRLTDRDRKHGSAKSGGCAGNQPSADRTAAAIRPPSARPAAFACTDLMTWPICRIVGAPPVDSATSATAASTSAPSSASSSCDGRYSPMISDSARSLSASSAPVAGVERLRRLLALAHLPGEHGDHVGVGELRGRSSRRPPRSSGPPAPSAGSRCARCPAPSSTPSGPRAACP